MIEQQVPEDYHVRLSIQSAARKYVLENKLIAPQHLDRLRLYAFECLLALDLSNLGYEYFTMVMLNNALWEGYFPTIAMQQRLLLLPFCLRNSEKCQAPRDELGLICLECNQCNTPEISKAAEALGMLVLVAESSSKVVQWVEQGEIDAVVGVSCLNSLEKAFPAMLKGAVPGIALPLITDGCANTAFDIKMLKEAVAIEEQRNVCRISYGLVKEHLDKLFTEQEVQKYLPKTMPYLVNF
ncbi:MAG: DUF116 domain-containing protein, partial [Lentisphaeria bacterium]